jgi:hypothetical protein
MSIINQREVVSNQKLRCYIPEDGDVKYNFIFGWNNSFFHSVNWHNFMSPFFLCLKG